MKQRKLTTEEQTLWESYTRGEIEVTAPNVAPVVPPKPPAVQLPPEYSPKLDLHNHTLADAHAAVMNHIVESKKLGKRRVIVVTGKSGQIAVEFPTWIHGNTLVTSYEKINGGGAWKVWLKKNTSQSDN